MKLDYKLFKKLLIAFGVLAPLSFGLRIYTYWKELDVTTGFFSGNGAGCTVFNMIGFAVFFLCLLLTYHKKGSDLAGSQNTISTPESKENDALLFQESETYNDEDEQDYPQFFLHGFAKKCAVWFGTFSAFAALLPGFAFICHAASFFLQKGDDTDVYATACAVLSLASGIFFLIYAFRNSAERSNLMAYLALAPAFWCTLRMIIEYRDLTRFLNKPLYIGQFLFVISALIFFLYQAEILLGDEALSRPNAYVFSGLSVVFLGVTARLSQLFAIMGARMQMDLYTSTVLLADLTLTVFVASKLLATTKKR